MASMVVDDLHSVRIPILPLEADAPLIVDPDSVLTGADASKLLEPIARWNAQIFKRFSGIDRDACPSQPPRYSVGGLDPASAGTPGGVGADAVRPTPAVHRSSRLAHMVHPIYHVLAAELVAPFTLRLWFDDHLERTIDFSDVLTGAVFGPLRDPTLFNQFAVDPEVRTITWPNGADFDPATLHDWPEHEDAFRSLARGWRTADG